MPRDESMLEQPTAAELYQFDCWGYVVIRNVFSPSYVAEMREILDRSYPPGALAQFKFPFLHLDRRFFELMTHPTILRLSEFFCGENFRLDHAFGVTSIGAEQSLHGGPDVSQSSCFNHWVGGKRMLIGQLAIGCVIDPQTPETGGVCFIPGSHKSYERRAGLQVFEEMLESRIDHEAIVTPTLNAGDLLCFTEGMVHGSTYWRGASGRRQTLYFKFTPGFMAWRDPNEQEGLRAMAKTDLERRILSPPWSGRFEESPRHVGLHSARRPPTIDRSGSARVISSAVDRYAPGVGEVARRAVSAVRKRLDSGRKGGGYE